MKSEARISKSYSLAQAADKSLEFSGLLKTTTNCIFHVSPYINKSSFPQQRTGGSITAHACVQLAMWLFWAFLKVVYLVLLQVLFRALSFQLLGFFLPHKLSESNRCIK